MGSATILALDIVLLVFFCLVLLGYLVFMLDMTLGGHDFATSRAGVKQVGVILKTFNKDTGRLYDLGSCRGNFIVGLLKFCPDLQAFGIDNNKLRILFSQSMSGFFRRPAVFQKGDIFSTDVSQADAVYIYLDQSLMPALESKLQKELRPGAVVITNTQSLPHWPPAQTFITHSHKPKYEKMFVYVKA